MEYILFSFIVLLCVIRISRGLRRKQPETVLFSALALLMYVGCLLVPAWLQAAGLLRSKLYSAAVANTFTFGELNDYVLRWSLELGLVLTAEVLANKFLRRRAGSSSRITSSALSNKWRHAPLVVALLLVVGLLSYLVFPPPALADRAVSGQGLGTTLRGFLLCGLAVLAYYGAFGRKVGYACLAGGIIFLALLNVRSPLVVIVLALILGGIERGSFSSRKRIVQAVCVVVLLSLGGSLMSNFRGYAINGQEYSASEVIADTLSNPLLAPYESGIDTFDGYRLSLLVLPYEEAKPEALLAAVTTFVPRALWPEKPGSLSNDISKQYLGYGEGGQFLSPIGYLSLALGSYEMGLVGFFLFAFAVASLFSRLKGTPWMAIVLVVAFRFLLGGDAFDVFYGLSLAVMLFAARTAVNWTLQNRLTAFSYYGGFKTINEANTANTASSGVVARKTRRHLAHSSSEDKWT